MTQTQWLTCTNPQLMLSSLQRKASIRKFRLFTVACYRHIWHIISEDHVHAAIEVAERFADGLASQKEMRQAAKQISWHGTALPSGKKEATFHACGHTVRLAVERAPLLEGGVITKVVAAQVSNLRDIFGNPYRLTPLDPAWLAWRDATVPKIAQTIYEGRRFEDMPILGDALEEAGCADTDILNHCRGAAGHVRGCWVVDLMLGKK